jgi:DNA-binding IclR family transcriptional regulator
VGAGGGGLAILGALAADERGEVLARVMPLLEQAWRVSHSVLRKSIALFDEEGHALIRNRVQAGVSAIGYPVRGALGQPIAALSIATFNERLGPQRIGTVVGRLQQAARELQNKLAASRTVRPA